MCSARDLPTTTTGRHVRDWLCVSADENQVDHPSDLLNQVQGVIFGSMELLVLGFGFGHQ